MEVWVRDGGGDGGDGVDWGRKRKKMGLDFGRRRWRFVVEKERKRVWTQKKKSKEIVPYKITRRKTPYTMFSYIVRGP